MNAATHTPLPIRRQSRFYPKTAAVKHELFCSVEQLVERVLDLDARSGLIDER